MSTRFFGQFLLEKGAIDSAQLLAAVDIQHSTNIRLGTRAIDAGFMDADAVDRVNAMQRRVDKRFGELAVAEGFLTEEQLSALLSSQMQERLMLGEALVKIDALTSEQLGQHLQEFKDEVKGIPGTLSELFFEKPNSQTLEIFTDVTCKMFTRLLHMFVKPADSKSAVSDASQCEFTIHQSFQGDLNGTICLNVSASLLKEAASKLLGAPVTEVDADTVDGAGEFVNIIGGNICAKLSSLGKKVEIAPPLVSDNSKEPFDLAGMAKASHFAVIPLLHPDEAIELCVIEAI